jgi:hypothetical protein
MGGTNSIINVANTTIDLNEYTCSNRGLILPRKHFWFKRANFDEFRRSRRRELELNKAAINKQKFGNFKLINPQKINELGGHVLMVVSKTRKNEKTIPCLNSVSGLD